MSSFVCAGNSSYLLMQQWQNYNFSSAANKFGWQAYPSSQWAPFICEKALALYDCELVNVPPRLPAGPCECITLLSINDLAALRCSQPLPARANSICVPALGPVTIVAFS
jgi:hypothetical protein